MPHHEVGTDRLSVGLVEIIATIDLKYNHNKRRNTQANDKKSQSLMDQMCSRAYWNVA